MVPRSTYPLRRFGLPHGPMASLDRALRRPSVMIALGVAHEPCRNLPQVASGLPVWRLTTRKACPSSERFGVSYSIFKEPSRAA
jgi:hypothetical protein